MKNKRWKKSVPFDKNDAAIWRNFILNIFSCSSKLEFRRTKWFFFSIVVSRENFKLFSDLGQKK